MKTTLLYIAADNRSGSTLLDVLLGNHSAITSVGEVRNLRAYAGDSRRYFNPTYPLLCSCGQQLTACEFWLKVQQEIGRRLDDLHLNFSFTRGRQPDGTLDRFRRRLERRLVAADTDVTTNGAVQRILGYRKVARSCFEFYDAVSRVSGCPFVCDSSKLPLRLGCLLNFAPCRVKTIILVRNPLAVAYSNQKRGKDALSAAHNWFRIYASINRCVKRCNKDQVLTLLYEELCTAPKFTLERVCEFLGIDFQNRVLLRDLTGQHHLGGSPSKYDDSANIAVDQIYRHGLPLSVAQEIALATKDIALRFGYSLDDITLDQQETTATA